MKTTRASTKKLKTYELHLITGGPIWHTTVTVQARSEKEADNAWHYPLGFRLPNAESGSKVVGLDYTRIQTLKWIQSANLNEVRRSGGVIVMKIYKATRRNETKLMYELGCKSFYVDGVDGKLWPSKSSAYNAAFPTESGAANGPKLWGEPIAEEKLNEQSLTITMLR